MTLGMKLQGNLVDIRNKAADVTGIERTSVRSVCKRNIQLDTLDVKGTVMGICWR